MGGEEDGVQRIRCFGELSVLERKRGVLRSAGPTSPGWSDPARDDGRAPATRDLGLDGMDTQALRVVAAVDESQAEPVHEDLEFGKEVRKGDVQPLVSRAGTCEGKHADAVPQEALVSYPWTASCPRSPFFLFSRQVTGQELDGRTPRGIPNFDKAQLTAKVGVSLSGSVYVAYRGDSSLKCAVSLLDFARTSPLRTAEQEIKVLFLYLEYAPVVRMLLICFYREPGLTTVGT